MKCSGEEGRRSTGRGKPGVCCGFGALAGGALSNEVGQKLWSCAHWDKRRDLARRSSPFSVHGSPQQSQVTTGTTSQGTLRSHRGIHLIAIQARHKLWQRVNRHPPPAWPRPSPCALLESSKQPLQLLTRSPKLASPVGRELHSWSLAIGRLTAISCSSR